MWSATSMLYFIIAFLEWRSGHRVRSQIALSTSAFCAGMGVGVPGL
jgi:hypothetical protein